MLHRAVSAIIVVFWVVMTWLLIRSEVNPDGAGLRVIPIEHVLKVLYLHEQPSELRVYSGAKPIGYFRLHPHTDKGTGQRLMDFTGTIQVYSTPEQRHRISWDGTLELSDKGEVQKTDWAITVQDPGFVRIEISAVSGAETAHLVMKSRDRVLDERDVPMNEAGFAGLVNQVGATGEVANLLQQPAAHIQPQVKARVSTLRFHGERTDTYLVTLEHNGQVYLEAHFSQLGQILQAKTMLGYTLRIDD